MELIEPTSGIIGASPPRVDAADKVTGRARYGADQPAAGTAHAYLVTAGPALGTIDAIDERAARAVPGVIEVFTHRNVGKAVGPGRWFKKGGHMATTIAPLAEPRICFAGQIVGMVVAETFEAARAAAMLLRVEVSERAPTAGFDDPGAKDVHPDALGETQLATGDAEAAFAAAPVRVDAWYETPPQHHNPLELFQATCAWHGDQLTIWESTQNTRGVQYGVAKQLGIRATNVRVLSPVIGGAFGSRGEVAHHTALVAFAARRLGRPVKLVVTRAQGFELRTFRAETRHHVKLAAERDGRLVALTHDSWELCNRNEPFALAGSDQTARLYACPNIRTEVKTVSADRQAPGFMRAPPEVPYLFALESAMDELSYELGIDPLDLRRRNETSHEPIKGLPFTSRSLVKCIDTGAQAFGWDRRDPRPASMRDGDELVGYGFASAFYPTQMGPADAKVTLTPDARAIVEIGTHEIGTGVRTVMAQVAADLLGVGLDRVEVRIGDSRLPATPLSAGSNSTATCATVIGKACLSLRKRLAAAAVRSQGPLAGGAADSVQLRDGHAWIGNASEPLETAIRRVAGGKAVVARATNNPHGAPPVIGPSLIRRGMLILTGGTRLKDRVQFAFGAQFVEVRVDRHTGQIRVPRVVGAYAGGRIMNRRTATSQLTGGQLWGLSAALHEATEIDRRRARYMNASLGEYHIPVNADIGTLEAIIVDERDEQVNPFGIKGIGELGTTGMNAAVANAVFHATGRRVRSLPIHIEDALPAG